MPGAGKSTLGKILAEKIGHNFFDLDREIERMAGWVVSDIFNQLGEDHFRELEQSVLEMLIALNEPCLISTGGGTPCFFDNLEVMQQAGPTIFLNTPIDVVIDRVKSDKGSRPLVKEMDDATLEADIRALFTKRLPFYEKASFTSDSDMDEITTYLEFFPES